MIRTRHRVGNLLTVLVAAAAITVCPAMQAAALSPAQQAVPAQQSTVAVQVTATAAASAVPEATVTITIAPPLPGVRLSMDGAAAVVTDESGVAVVTRDRAAGAHTLTLLDTSLETTGKRYSFDRWVGQRDQEQAFTPTLDGLTMRGDSSLTATFSVAYAVTAHVVDQNGAPIDPSEISSAAARSDTGAVVSLAPSGPTWLEGTRVTARSNKYELQNVTYSWQSVVVSGTNVVDAGRQSFTPATNADVTGVGQFHDLTVAGYDAVLGRGAGEQAVITLPDGTVRSARLDSAHSAVFPHLPRGTYRATVTAGASVVGDQQVRLSRDITVRATVISPIDIAILLGLLVLVAGGLILVGRRHVRRRLLAPFRPADPAELEVG
jgi:hypothetical protein